MKHLIRFTLILLPLLAACGKDYRVYEDTMGARAYFIEAVSSDLLSVSSGDLDASGRLWLTVYNAGYDRQPNHIRIVADEQALAIRNLETGGAFRLLPAKYWQLDHSELTLDSTDNISCKLGVRLDIAAFQADACFPGDYLLPLSLDGGGTQYGKRTLFIKLIY